MCLGHLVASFLVIVGDLDVGWPRRGPREADPELVVDPDRVLTGSVPGRLLQAVAWRDAQIIECAGRVEEAKFLLRSPLDVGAQPGRALATPDLLRARISEGLDGHIRILSLIDTIAEQRLAAMWAEGRSVSCMTSVSGRSSPEDGQHPLFRRSERGWGYGGARLPASVGVRCTSGLNGVSKRAPRALGPESSLALPGRKGSGPARSAGR